MRRFVAGLEYDGAPFCGWQSQKNGCGVQDALQRALSPANGGTELTIHAAGRTDAGVHAAMQIAHFDSAVSRTPEEWMRIANANLPAQIRILQMHFAPPEFHSRHSALRRFYRYAVLRRPSALLSGFAAFCSSPPPVQTMHEGAKFLSGRHDFSAFRAAACQAKTPVRTMYDAKVSQRGDYIFFDFCADGFLHKMARNIVGALLQLNRKDRDARWIAKLLRQKTRAICPPPAPPHGLYFCGAEYPGSVALPAMRRLPPFAPPNEK